MSEKLLLLNRDKIAAMKAGDRTRKDILILLINEANNIAKNDPAKPNREVTDDDLMQSCNRTIKKARELIKIVNDKGLEVDSSVPENEIAVAQSYLPQQMSRDELATTIRTIIGGDEMSPKVKGKVMKALNTDHKGNFDSQMANEVLAEIIAGATA
jgi:uncharacterized protein YqeY